MAEIKDSQLIRDALGSPVPQYWDETSQMYIARTVDGSFADVDFSKVRLLRDKLGSPIPQLWDTETARFVPGNGGGNGDVTIESVPGLRSELDQTNATLAEKAQVSYVDTKVAAVASGAPKGTYATLTALQTAFPTGNTNIYLVTADGKWYYWNGTTWTAGGVYQATAIEDNSVNLNKISTDFKQLLDVTQTPINLFNGTTVQGIVSSSNGAMVYVSASNYSTDFIAVNPAKPIYTNWLELLTPSGLYPTQGMSCYDAGRVFIGSVSSATSKITPLAGTAFVKQSLKYSGTYSVDPLSYKLYQDTNGSLMRLNAIESDVATISEEIESKYGIKSHHSNVFYPIDFVDGVLTDSQAIKNCLDFSAPVTDKVIIFTEKDWFLDEAILIPKNTTIIVDGCLIKQKDYVFDNVFRGDNLVIDTANPDGYPTSISPTENIKILGFNGARVEGCNVNATKTHPTLGAQLAVGDYWGWRTLLFSLSKCTNFEISGFKISKTRCWALSFDKCSYGDIHDLEITSNVKNGDGVDLRSGCHHIKVYNISGSTSDDSVAMSAINYAITGNYVYSMEPSKFEDAGLPIADLAIHDISVSNITTVGAHHGVICLSSGGRKVYNVSINGVKEPTASTRTSVIAIYTGYGGVYTAGDLSRIRVNDVLSKGATNAVEVTATVNDVWFNKIIQEKAGAGISAFTNPAGITITNS